MTSKFFPARLGLGLFVVWQFIFIAEVAGSAALAADPALLAGSPPPRVVYLVPAATEIIRALDGEEMLVGMTSHDDLDHRVETPMVVGDFLAPSLERIIVLEPSLIIIAEIAGGKTVATLTNHGGDHNHAEHVLQRRAADVSPAGLFAHRPDGGDRAGHLLGRGGV